MAITKQKITPCLWFDTEAEEAAKFYCSVFKDSKLGKVSRYTEAGREVHHKPAGSVMENVAPMPDVMVFPQPRLQTNDSGDMEKFLTGEQKILNPEQPFRDRTGAIHVSIAEAMKLIEQRGLPVRPNAPPPDFTAETAGGSMNVLSRETAPPSETGRGLASSTPTQQ